MDGVRLGRRLAVSPVQDQPRRQAQRAPSSLSRPRPEDDGRLRLRAGGQAELRSLRADFQAPQGSRGAHLAGGSSRTDRRAPKSRATPKSNSASAGPTSAPRQNMRARFGFVRGDSNRPGLEERGVGDDAIGRSVDEPGLAALSGIERVESQDPHALGKSVARRVGLRRARLPRDQAARDRPMRTGRAQRALARPRRRPRRRRRSGLAERRPPPRQASAASVPTRWPRLGWARDEPPAEPSVLGQTGRNRGAFELRRWFRHRAILFPDPLRLGDGEPALPLLSRSRSALAGTRATPLRRPYSGRRRNRRPARPSGLIR